MTKKKATSNRTPRSSTATATRVVGRRAQNKAAIRKRIVTAALSLFQIKGFDATTTKAIARKAGITEGTVFNYFRTKEDIALYFFEQEVDQAIASVRDNPRLRKAPLEEKLFALVHSQLEFLAPYERFIGAAFIHALKPASPLGTFSHRAQSFVTAMSASFKSCSTSLCRNIDTVRSRFWRRRSSGFTTWARFSTGCTIRRPASRTRWLFWIDR